MSYDNIFSDWLAASFDSITVTKEWNLFISDLYDSVDHQLAENNIDNFNNLLDHEKTLIIQRALQSLSGSISYQIISDKISQTLDLQINNEAERIIRIDLNPFHTRTEAILIAAYEGIISILGRWEDLKSKLTVMFNQNMPKHLRHHIWKVILANKNVLQTYHSAMKTKSKENISKYDKEISQYCENLLNNEPVLLPMKGSVGCFYGMKAVLSYFQATQLKDKKLNHKDYLLMTPLVFVLHEKLSLREPPTIKVMEVLVQQYFSLRNIISDDLPFIYNSDQNSRDHYRIFCQQVFRYIVTIDLSSAEALMDNILPSQDSRNQIGTRNVKWSHWFDSLHHPTLITPQNRLDLRILRQKEREKFQQLQNELELVQKDKAKMDATLEMQANAYSSNYNMMAQKFQKEKVEMNLQLEDMKERQKNDTNVINELMREVERLRSTRVENSSLKSYRLPLPPPGTPRSPGSTISAFNRPPDDITKFAREYVSQLSKSFQTILHGEGGERFELNDRTIEFLKQYEDEKRQVEMRLFGKVMDPQELRILDEANDGYYSQKICQEMAKMHDKQTVSDVAANSTI